MYVGVTVVPPLMRAAVAAAYWIGATARPCPYDTVICSTRPNFGGNCGAATGPTSVRMGPHQPKRLEKRLLPLGTFAEREHARADV